TEDVLFRMGVMPILARLFEIAFDPLGGIVEECFVVGPGMPVAFVPDGEFALGNRRCLPLVVARAAAFAVTLEFELIPWSCGRTWLNVLRHGRSFAGTKAAHA